MSCLNSNDLRRIFDKLDRNGDGYVTLDELQWILERIGFSPCSLDDLRSLIGSSGLNFIDFWFFYDAIVKRREGENNRAVEDGDRERDLINAFKVFDENGDGFISSDELERALLRLGLWEEERERERDCCKSMIGVFDSNSDGVLDFEEFRNMMLGTNS